MCYPGSNSSVPLCADSFAGWCLAPFIPLLRSRVYFAQWHSDSLSAPSCALHWNFITHRENNGFAKTFEFQKNCFQSGSFWVTQSHFFKGDRKVIALAAFKMQGCQSLRPRTSVGNTFHFCRESYWLGQNTVRARPQFWHFFKRIRGFSVKKGLLFTQNSCSCWHLPFAAFQFPFTGALTNAHTHIFPYLFAYTHTNQSDSPLLFLSVSALQTFHWMFYRVARNTKHVEEARGACHSSLIHLNATWRRFTLHQRQGVTLEECLFFPQLIDCECPSLRSINHVFLDSAAFILCFSLDLDSILLDTSYIPDQKRLRKIR